MDKNLFQLIQRFNIAQGEAVQILELKFKCSRPLSQMDYILRCVPIIREANCHIDGYKIRPHGVGMETWFNGKQIDFDFGEKWRNQWL